MAKYSFFAFNAKRLPCDCAFHISECKCLGVRCYPPLPLHTIRSLVKMRKTWLLHIFISALMVLSIFQTSCQYIRINEIYAKRKSGMM